MNPRNLFFAVASVIVMGASLMSQGLTDGVRVTLPHPVTIDDVVLEPGEYEIRRPSANTNDQVLRFFNNDKLRYQTIAQTIPTTAGEDPPEKSKIILHHIGDKYYFDKIWIEGKTYGYEFPLPERVRALQKELAVTVPATLHTSEAGSGPINTAPSVVSSTPSRERVDALAPPEPTPLVQDTQNREIPARVESEAPEQVAVLQQEQRNTPPPSIDARQDGTQSTTPRTPSVVEPRQADELPATASGWVVYLLSGGLFLILAASMRPVRARG